MGAISALSTTGRTLKRNSVLFAIAFVVSLLSVAPSGPSAIFPPSTAVLVSLPLYALVVFLGPFFMGGLLSMASEGIDGTTRIETFVEGGKENYLSLFGALVLVGICFGILASVVTFGITVVGVFAVGMSSAGAGGATAGSLGIVALLGLLGAFVVLLPMFFLQFYAPAIVVSDYGIVGSLKHSAGVVRRNIVSTLGYSAVIGLAGLVAGVAGFVLSMASGAGRIGATRMLSPEVGLGFAVAGLLLMALVSTVVSAFGSVYQVAFYEETLLGEDETDADDATQVGV
ncbi:DUF7847 domain-containing protein [Halorussus ruber]|uniref:DUF7847 domain-containing protein n=1 Tax=Halorussus ruber TaxID=1126238 RepID=UPI001092B890|nr:hypothetical protein [Halorussus ruber]